MVDFVGTGVVFHGLVLCRVFIVSVFLIAVKNGAIRAVGPRLRFSGCQPCVSAAAQGAGHPRGGSQTGGTVHSLICCTCKDRMLNIFKKVFNNLVQF